MICNFFLTYKTVAKSNPVPCIKVQQAKGVLPLWRRYRSVKRTRATKLHWFCFGLFAQWFSTSATPDATEDEPALVCFRCDLLYVQRTAAKRKTGWNHDVSVESDQPPKRCCVTHHGLLYFRCLSRNRRIPRWSFSEKQEKQQQQWLERGQPPLKFCANYVERGKRRTIFSAFVVEGGSGARKCHSKRKPTRLQVSTWSHEPPGKLLLARSHGR